MGHLEFEDKRALVELMDVQGVYRVEGTLLLLDLFIYSIEFESFEITEIGHERKPENSRRSW